MILLPLICIGLFYAPSTAAETAAWDVAAFGAPRIVTFTDRDGLPQGSAEAIAIDRRGRLWVGTRGGAARFDGRTWMTVDLPGVDKSKWVRAVHSAADGSIWLATESGGVHRLRPDGTWLSHQLPDRVTAHMKGFMEAKEGGKSHLWCATEKGLVRFDKDGLEIIDVPFAEGFAITALASFDGDLILGSGGAGFARRSDGRWQVFDRSRGLPGASVVAIAPTTSEKGRRLHLATEEALASFDGESFQIDERPGLPADRISTLVEVPRSDATSELWVGTVGDGLFRPGPQRWRSADPAGELPSSFILSLAWLAESKQLLVGTLHGVSTIRLDGWLAFDDQGGLPHNSVHSMLDGDSGLWLGTAAGGAAKWRGDRWQLFGEVDGLPHASVWVILETMTDSRRSLWMGTETGLLRRRGEEIEIFDDETGLPHSAIVALLEVPSRGQLWAGTFGGGVALFDLRRETWSVPEHAFEDGRVEALLNVPNPSLGVDDVWVATNRGLARLRGEQWTNLPVADLPALVTRRLHLTSFDGETRLLVGTGSGLVWTDPAAEKPTWQGLSEAAAERLPDDVIYRIEEDRKGRLYLCTNRGVARLTPSIGPEFHVESFGIEDGLPSFECSFGGSAIDQQGRIWVGTAAGAAIFDPSLELPEPTPAELHLGATVGRDAGRPIGDSAVLRHDESHLIFTYDLGTIFRKKDLRFRTHLVGLEEQPTDWSTANRRELFGVPAGSYRFEVLAKDHQGREIGPVSLGFERRPSPWRTWWALSAYSAIGAAAVFALMRWQSTSLRRRIRELEARLEGYSGA
ncbi:MAG: hypothetical protein MI919_01130 [Holophagales bacterium]|nr:hypothetical protein [Holophagales bacterium]